MSTGFSSWLRIVSSSWKPSPTARRSDHGELCVDVDGPRAGHEEEAGLEVLQIVDRQRIQPSPSSVKIHFERKRVSNENSPVGSVRDASMSPFAVADDECVSVEDLYEPVAHDDFPARTASRRCDRCRRPGENALEEDEQLWVALHADLSTKYCGHRIPLASDDRVEKRSVGSDYAVGLAIRLRHRHVALFHRNRPGRFCSFHPPDRNARFPSLCEASARALGCRARRKILRLDHSLSPFPARARLRSRACGSPRERSGQSRCRASSEGDDRGATTASARSGH